MTDTTRNVADFMSLFDRGDWVKWDCRVTRAGVERRVHTIVPRLRMTTRTGDTLFGEHGEGVREYLDADLIARDEMSRAEGYEPDDWRVVRHVEPETDLTPARFIWQNDHRAVVFRGEIHELIIVEDDQLEPEDVR